MSKELRTTIIEQIGKQEFTVTWWDGSKNIYNNWQDVLKEINQEFIYHVRN